MKRVRIKALPKDLPQAKDGHETEAKLWNGIQVNWPTVMNQFSLPPTTTGKTLQPVDREDANLEAEKGETAIINQDGIPTNFNIGGKRHSEGGTPLNLPSNSFIFSDTKDMKIKDKTILAQFGATKAMTPADISKKYDINKFRGTLADPDSTDLQRKTAEMMIANYNLKLAKLGLAQESKKGFPQGIPAISMPYVESTGMDPNSFFQTQAQPEQFNPDMTAAYGGSLPFAQQGMETQIQEHLRKKAAEKEAYQKNTEDYFNAASKDAMEYQANKELRNLYQKMQEKYKAGDIESKWYEMLPGVDPSAQSYLESFKAAAKKYGYDPTVLLNQYDVQSGKVKAQPKPAPVKKEEPTQLKAPATNTVDPNTVFNFKEGGSLPSYQKAGPVVPKHGWHYESGVYKLYNNGTVQKITDINPKTGKKEAPSAKKEEPVKGAPAKATTATTFKPYGEAVAELEKHVVPNAMMRKGEVSTHQAETAKGSGLYGDVEIPVDQFLKNNPTFATEFAQKHPGETYNPKNQEHVKEFQDRYNPILHDKVKSYYLKAGKGEAEATKFADAAVNEYGFKKGEKARDFDKKHGQFTGSRVELGFKDPVEVAAETGDKTKAAAAAAKTQQALATQQQPGHDPWWLQDIVKTAGAAGDFFRVKKYAPWQATPGVTLPDPTFYDPTRELAANAEMANLGVQGANAFTNPQAYAAAFSSIQGQGAKNAADILGKYNQMNVGVANDFELKRTDIMNQAAANRAGLSTQLADKYAIMNQQFDNSRNQARQNLRQSYIDAVTNKNYTGNMNDLYDQYKIDPSTGGRIRWTHGRPITPESSDQDMISKVNATALELRKQNPGLDADKAIEHAIRLHSAGATQGNKMYGQEALGYPGGQGQGPTT